MWTGISANSEPLLRKEILEETLFDWRCPHCGYEAELLYPCLYHDKARGFMVYMAPNSGEAPLQELEVNSRFPQLGGVQKRIVTTPTQLKEKLLIFEAGLDDAAVEIVKVGLAGIVAQKENIAVEAGCFCFADEATDRMGFLFFLQGQEAPVKKATRFATYTAALDICAHSGGASTEDFRQVDPQLATRLLESYRKQ